MTRGRKHKFIVVILVALPLFGWLLTLTSPKVQAANAGDVVINEIMYHASSDLDNDDYLELYNVTGSTINLDGWCFTAGITLCFNSSHSIAANSYIVVSRSTAQTQATYGVTPLAQYTGNLSNSGETVSLTDNNSNLIDTVTYGEAPPWPPVADGDGPSLELKATHLDNTEPENWGASITPTPGSENSIAGLALPTISNVSDPNNITAGNTVTVTATIQNEQSASLVYKVMFGNDVTLQMFDDGAHGDGAANDNVFGAQIPAQSAGQLVRFRVEATNPDGTATKPSNDDSIDYYGYAVQNSAVTASAPILQWFIEDDDYDTLYANENTSNRYNCVLVYGNDVYDNSEVRLKGNNTRPMPKKGFKFYLPGGYTIQLAGAERATDEFHMNADFTSQNIAKVPTLWWVAKQTGLPTPDVITTRLQKNGQFEGTYNFIDKFEKQWREDTGFDDGQLFEDFAEIVDGADNLNDLQTWRDNMVQDSRTTDGRNYILDNINIPAMMNVMAFPALTHHHDHTITHNLLQFKDDNTERWSVLHWDFDLALVDPANPKTLIGIYDDYGYHHERWYMYPIYDQPDLRQAYLRRLRTLVDELYVSDAFKNKYQELTDRYADIVALDLQKWGTDMRRTAEADLAMLERQRTSLLVHLRQEWGVPGAQTDSERQSISIAEVSTDINPANEYIRLENSSSAAVDLSDWQIEGVNYTLPKGTVVPGTSSIYLLHNDAGYRASNPSVLVAGEYQQSLGFFGNLTLKTNAGQVIDIHGY